MHHHKLRGFTLLELSIVLVIIGLLAGGILVARDLIAAAELRATIGQIQRYNTAVNTFRLKYNALPGDIPQTFAGAFGFFQMGTTATVGWGDGNGLVESAIVVGYYGSGETIVFWRHLSEANLIEGQYGKSGNSDIDPGTLMTVGLVTDISKSVPLAKLAGNAFVVYAVNGYNYFEIGPWTGINFPFLPWYTLGTTGITPIQSFAIDSKMDDGMPTTGRVAARGFGGAPAPNAPPSWAASSTTSKCVMDGTYATDPANTYNRNKDSGGNDPSCAMQFRFE